MNALRSQQWSRRDLLRMALAAPLAGLFTPLRALTAPHANRVKITDIKVMQIRNINGNSLIKIETDSGLVGYGETGASGPMARGRIEAPVPLNGGIEPMRNLLIGKDPLAIEVHFQNMTSLMHYYMANIPTVSGIDIALWDLAGKITGLPVYTLLGGPFRDSIRMYSHGLDLNMNDKASCRAFADRVKAMPEGFNAFKCGATEPLGVASARFANTLDQSQLRSFAEAFGNLREALPSNIEIAVHCHDEFDEPSSVALAKAVEPINPLFIEDLLFPTYSQAWMSVRRQVRVPLLTGEKLELLDGFKPFIDNEAVDIIHPDLSFAGGFTGVRKVAAYAYVARMPVALHNVGSLILTAANAHFGASIQNFYRSESQLGRQGRYIEGMAATPLEVRNSYLRVPTGPGLGLDINFDFLKQNLSAGETYWG